MNKPRFLVVTSSYIIKSGLSSLLNEMDAAVQFSEDEVLPDPLKCDLILLDPDSASPEAIAEQLNHLPVLEQPRIITLYREPGIAAKNSGNTLNLYGTKSQLLERLKSFTDPIPSGVHEEDHPEETLTSRERKILEFVALGKTSKEIADQLNISMHTVITHRKNISRKLGIKTVSGLTVYAIINGIIRLEDI